MIAWIRRVLGLPARRASSSPSVPRTPIDCPECSGLIVADEDGAFYACKGLPTREDVVRALTGRVPVVPAIESRKPCGWRDRADGFGTAWW